MYHLTQTPPSRLAPAQYVVVTVSLKAGLEMQAWTWLTHLAIWGSIGVWFVFLLIYSRLPFAYDMLGLDTMMFSSPVFWLGLIMVPTTTMLPDVVFKRCVAGAGWRWTGGGRRGGCRAGRGTRHSGYVGTMYGAQQRGWGGYKGYGRSGSRLGAVLALYLLRKLFQGL